MPSTMVRGPYASLNTTFDPLSFLRTLPLKGLASEISAAESGINRWVCHTA
jgi:hypothetical protein